MKLFANSGRLQFAQKILRSGFKWSSNELRAHKECASVACIQFVLRLTKGDEPLTELIRSVLWYGRGKKIDDVLATARCIVDRSKKAGIRQIFQRNRTQRLCELREDLYLCFINFFYWFFTWKTEKKSFYLCCLYCGLLYLLEDDIRTTADRATFLRCCEPESKVNSCSCQEGLQQSCPNGPCLWSVAELPDVGDAKLNGWHGATSLAWGTRMHLKPHALKRLFLAPGVR